MQEQEFEKQKQFLLSKLPDYLKSKGINVNSNFFCLNPTDTAHIPSMSYDASNYTVKCFNCNAVYNIFDLIGIDFNISDFSHQFIKAHELYIGKVPLGFIDVLKNYNNQKQSEIRTTTFEIENNNFLASHSSQKEVRVPLVLMKTIITISSIRIYSNSKHNLKEDLIPFHHSMRLS